VDVGLTRSYRTAKRDVAVKAWIVNRQVDSQRQVLAYLAKYLVTAVLADDDLPVAQGFESRTHDTSR
jgi:hypothetical protein